MLIDILNSNMKKLDLLRKYTYVQYVKKFRDIGTFTIHVRLCDENIYLLDKTQNLFVLFDNKVLGKIEHVIEADDFEYEQTIQITGRLSNYILTKRVIDGTISYKGNTAGYAKALIEREFVNTPMKRRRINITVEYKNSDRMSQVSSKITKTQTGTYVWDEMQPYLNQDKLGIEIVPVVDVLHTVDGVETNISQWKAIIDCGVDKTQFNKDGNEALIFSKSLSNIARTDYDRDTTNYRGVAYIAGEGEGDSRKWFTKYRPGEETKSGWNRDELWIDARDIQSTKEGTDENGEPETMTPEEYEKLINQRVDEKFAECEVSESYSSTITKDKERLIYEGNVFLGDWVTIKDERLGLVVEAQVVEVTITEQNSQRIIDLGVEYGTIKKDIVEVTKTLVEKVESQQSTINYLLNNGGSGGGSGGPSGGSATTVSIEVGEVESLSPNANAYVRNVGTAQNARFNFGIPRGQQGPQGAQGPQGLPGATGEKGEKGNKGDRGNDGKSAGFGNIVASVDDGVGVPSVEVSTNGTNEALNITFDFHNLKGQRGEQGKPGAGGTANIDLSGLLKQLSELQFQLLGYELLTNEFGNPIIADGNYINIAEKKLKPNQVYSTDENGNPLWVDMPDVEIPELPDIPIVNNGKLSISVNGTLLSAFTANQEGDVEVSIAVPTKTSELENDSGYKTTDNDTWLPNTKEQSGYVEKPIGANMVWGTDEEGNPTWLDMPSGGSDLGPTLGDVTNLVVDSGKDGVELMWSDPEDIIFNDSVVAEWAGTKVVRKSDLSPVSVEDGELILDSTVRDNYKESPFVDASAVDGESYIYTLFPYTKKGAITESDLNSVSIIYNKPPDVSPILAENSWEKIAMVAESGKAADYWKVGDTKTITLQESATASKDYTFEIIGFNCEMSTEGVENVNGITFWSKELLDESYPSNQIQYGYRTWVVNDKLSMFPEEVKKHIKVRRHKLWANEKSTKYSTYDASLFMLSAPELGGFGESVEDYAHYKYLSDATKRIKTGGFAGTYITSTKYSVSPNNYGWYRVNGEGRCGGAYYGNGPYPYIYIAFAI